MFSKRLFRRRNKPRSQNFLENNEQQKETPFVPPVQTKLNIGKPGDKYEVEADRTADEVVSKSESPDSVQKMDSEEEVQTKPLAESLTPFVQKQEAAEEEEAVQAQAEEEEEAVQAQEEEEEPVQAQEMEEEEEQVQAQEEEEEAVQAKSAKNILNSNQLSSELNASKGSGTQMDSKTQMEMEKAFGNDFSQVNIHTDAKAIAMTKQLHAQAFTHGNDIYFNSGKYHPNSKKGKHLLAHELTHTIQQGNQNPKKSLGGHHQATTIQRVPIDHRAITWADFQGPVDEDSKYSAATMAPIKIDITPGYIKYDKPTWDGTTATVTILYDPAFVSIKGIMETDQSWKKDWLTDDEAAEREFGPDVNITEKRETLLAHEQIHFDIAEAIAKSYLDELRAALPTTPYVETKATTNEKDVQPFADAVLDKKMAELDTAFIAINNKANTELTAVQEIYDKSTVHSKKFKKQEKWQNDFEAMLKAAREKAKADAAAQYPGAN
ncbi:MAG: DUF4157 domain-containing protein [Flavobacteriaceae bacterium]